ncbi:MAG: hypothetical protein MZU84_07880 [Sphingobacterium sp.]|nr:hypothetical protein [Sphingobacterium sp.]
MRWMNRFTADTSGGIHQEGQLIEVIVDPFRIGPVFHQADENGPFDDGFYDDPFGHNGG